MAFPAEGSIIGRHIGGVGIQGAKTGMRKDIHFPFSGARLMDQQERVDIKIREPSRRGTDSGTKLGQEEVGCSKASMTGMGEYNLKEASTSLLFEERSPPAESRASGLKSTHEGRKEDCRPGDGSESGGQNSFDRKEEGAGPDRGNQSDDDQPGDQKQGAR